VKKPQAQPTTDAACHRAFSNAIDALRQEARFPDNVFVGSWSNYLFLESDALFVGHFIWAVKEFLRTERAASACLVNLGRKRLDVSIERCAICLSPETTNDEYQERLRVGGSDAWLYDMEDYVCASDIGSWCVYAEKKNDAAVIALRNVAASNQFHHALGYLGADSLTYLLRSQFPFTEMVADWRSNLIRNYKPSRGRNLQ
jgi:hypothetical protein